MERVPLYLPGAPVLELTGDGGGFGCQGWSQQLGRERIYAVRSAVTRSRLLPPGGAESNK